MCVCYTIKDSSQVQQSQTGSGDESTLGFPADRIAIHMHGHWMRTFDCHRVLHGRRIRPVDNNGSVPARSPGLRLFVGCCAHRAALFRRVDWGRVGKPGPYNHRSRWGLPRIPCYPMQTPCQSGATCLNIVSLNDLRPVTQIHYSPHPTRLVEYARTSGAFTAPTSRV